MADDGSIYHMCGIAVGLGARDAEAARDEEHGHTNASVRNGSTRLSLLSPNVFGDDYLSLFTTGGRLTACRMFTQPPNGSATKHQRTNNSWVFVRLATGLAVTLNGTGPRPYLTSPAVGEEATGVGRSRRARGPTDMGGTGYCGRETTGGELTILTWPGRWHTLELPVAVH